MSVNGIRTGALVVIALCCASLAQAQEILLTGPLAAAPAPIPHYFWRKGRLEVAPATGAQIGANDNPSWLWGGEALFYPWDRLGGGFVATGASRIIGRRPNELHAAFGPELVVVPLAGKAGIFDAYIPYDVHLEAGALRVIARQADVTEGSWALMLGGGVTAFSSSFFSTTLDYRILIGDSSRHTLILSFGFWLPKRHRYGE